MKRKLTVKRGTIPKPLTANELQMLKKFFYLPGWQFKETILPKCTLISEATVKVTDTKNEDGGTDWEYKYAEIYGLECLKGINKQKAFTTFFIRYENFLYQSCDIDGALEMIRIIIKDVKREDYLEAKEDEKEEKKKLKQTA